MEVVDRARGVCFDSTQDVERERERERETGTQ